MTTHIFSGHIFPEKSRSSLCGVYYRAFLNVPEGHSDEVECKICASKAKDFSISLTHKGEEVKVDPQAKLPKTKIPQTRFIDSRTSEEKIMDSVKAPPELTVGSSIPVGATYFNQQLGTLFIWGGKTWLQAPKISVTGDVSETPKLDVEIKAIESTLEIVKDTLKKVGAKKSSPKKKGVPLCCPFCESNRVVCTSKRTRNKTDNYQCLCKKCFARGPFNKDKSAAIEMWNRGRA